jgi:antitoxin YefM
MKTKSYSELRKNLAAALDSVTDDHEPLIITRDRGRPAAGKGKARKLAAAKPEK